jgi:hypothetical protein
MAADNDEPPWMAELRAYREANPRTKLSDEPPPPWIKYPDIPRSSIGWRMGAGEDYRRDFHDWFGDLSPAERVTYRQRWPEPADWAGYFDILDKR